MDNQSAPVPIVLTHRDGNWISVEEALPPLHREVIVRHTMKPGQNDAYGFAIAIRKEETWLCAALNWKVDPATITHWKSIW